MHGAVLGKSFEGRLSTVPWRFALMNMLSVGFGSQSGLRLDDCCPICDQNCDTAIVPPAARLLNFKVATILQLPLFAQPRCAAALFGFVFAIHETGRVF